ncbi:cupredoxin domain-containing protein [Niallia oryzisoli]|uniref:Cupredoxin domain-containing protein n=1 Tax=Niallia oryzisoli TaxID=1737571 RepID=A0ABZ2CNJ0_9BACI
MKLVIIKKRLLWFCIIFMVIIASAGGWYFINQENEAVFKQAEKARVIHLVTGEFSSELPDGTKIESYRWDPGTIFLQAGEKVQLAIQGINGKEHPFMIENTNIKGTIKKGEETTVPLQINEEGVYRLICLTHTDNQHEGPMIAYIVVD